MLEYANGNFYFLTSNLRNLSFGLHKEKFDLFTSFLTIGGIIIAITQWMYNISVRRGTDLNGLLEEIHHNFNISGDLFLQYRNEALFFAKIHRLLQMQAELVYPNPDNVKFDNQYFNDCFHISNSPLPTGIIKLRNSFVNHSITSDNIFSLTKQRIYINLGHLGYSVSRHNLNIDRFNSIRNRLHKTQLLVIVRKEYYTWVHFRLAFMLVDLVMNSKEKYFIDKEYVRRIKKYIENTNV